MIMMAEKMSLPFLPIHSFDNTFLKVWKINIRKLDTYPLIR
jgi:hypothetical protein